MPTQDPAEPAAAPHLAERTERLFSHRPFLRFWISRVLSATSYQMTGVVFGWLVYDLTGSAYALGLIGLFQFLPILLLTFIVGQIADSFSRRAIVTICQLLQGATLATVSGLALAGALSVPLIYLAVFVLGIARAFEAPTMSAVLPGILPVRLLHRGISVSSSAIQTAMIVGPALGGLIYGFGVVYALLLAALCFVAAAIAAAGLQTGQRPVERQPVTLASTFSGLAFIRRERLVLGIISLDLFAVLFGGVTSLLPIFARDVLETGPFGLGLLRAAPAIGALLMSIFVTRRIIGRGVGLKMFGAVALFGVATIVFALSRDLGLSLAALFLLGAADNVSVVLRNSLVVLLTPDAMRGRVNAVNSLFIGTSNQIGDFESGMVAGLAGAVPAAVIGGVATILVVLLWMRLFPELRDLDQLPATPAA